MITKQPGGLYFLNTITKQPGGLYSNRKQAEDISRTKIIIATEFIGKLRPSKHEY